MDSLHTLYYKDSMSGRLDDGKKLRTLDWVLEHPCFSPQMCFMHCCLMLPLLRLWWLDSFLFVFLYNVTSSAPNSVEQWLSSLASKTSLS